MIAAVRAPIDLVRLSTFTTVVLHGALEARSHSLAREAQSSRSISFLSKDKRKTGACRKARERTETNGRNITFQNRSGHHEKSYPDLISKVNLSRGLIKTEDQTWGPCSRTICPCCPPASVAIVRPVYPRGERSFGPTGVDTFHVISQHRLILCINIVLYFAQGMLPLYHFVINIF